MASRDGVNQLLARGSTADNNVNQATDSGPASSSSQGYDSSSSSSAPAANKSAAFPSSLPSVTLPKSGGAIRKIDEKFEVNPSSGTCSLNIPINVSKARTEFASPSMSLSYNSGGGNGPFGLGWGISVPTITRKTDKGIPRYVDGEDIFVFSGAEDLVPRLTQGTPNPLDPDVSSRTTIGGAEFIVRQYLPRIEGTFFRIEQWTNTGDRSDIYWRVLTADNYTLIFGRDDLSRIGGGDGRIYSWLLCQSYDDYGNAIEYSYKAEDSVGVPVPSLASERNRTRSRNRYLKTIKYGNRVPNRYKGWDVITSSGSNPWMFEVVFDYGDHSSNPPTLACDSDWKCRKDPFSTYRAGFEIRTYRLCRRILMFHHFPDETGVEDYLVASTEFGYAESGAASLLKTVSNFGHVLGKDVKIPMPALCLNYGEAPRLDNLVVRDSDAPFDLAGNEYQWIDLDSEGLPGVLSEQGGGWFYRRNLSANNFEDSSRITVPRFGPLEILNSHPAPGLSHDTRLVDLEGTGEVDLVHHGDGIRGFYERTTEDGWVNFRPFSCWPNIDFSKPNVQFVDLTGDGLADIMVTEDEAFSWFRSLGKEGYSQAHKTFQSLDEEKGPKLVFADGTQTIYLSDFSGDGLHDLVRIRNGDICYWPSLGYGEFGEKVTMDNAPWFDNVDQFTHDRLRLSDIDGSGTTDLIYLSQTGGASIYRNQAGNGWSNGDRLRSFPPLDNMSVVSTVDLLGNGCACLVWTHPLSPSRGEQTLRYIDLMNGRKPFLLESYTNGLGLETKVSYMSSTRFYLDAQRDGKPWITRLPFPVQCVEKTEIFDHVSKSYSSTRYAYHHGFYDRVDREYRGFGMVEQWDTERDSNASSFPGASNMDNAYFVAPIHKKTWFHTGAHMIPALQKTSVAQTISHQFIADYFQNKPLLNDSVLPASLGGSDYREATRSLKGMVLRVELYADDSEIPFRVDEKNYTISAVQPSQTSPGHPAVFLVSARESMTSSRERGPDDPRVTHTIDLDSDKYGNVLKSVSIAYGRKLSDTARDIAFAAQDQTHVTYSEYGYTNAIVSNAHVNPRLYKTRDYHLTGSSATGISDESGFRRFVADDFLVLGDEIPYEQEQTAAASGKRLIRGTYALYRSNDLTCLLPGGEIESLAIPGESYKLALTPGLIDSVYQRTGESLIPNVADLLAGKGGYVQVETDNNWWIPSGRHGFDFSAGADAELAEARSHFFMHKAFTDQFGNTSVIQYDVHDLLPVELIDPLGNIINLVNNYVHLQPNLITDANGNRTQVMQDPLGEVVGTAVMGKVGEQLGDSLEDFDWAISEEQKAAFLENPKGDIAAKLLANASTRTIIIDNWSPTTTTLRATISRETHVNGLTSPSKLLISFVYFDGLNRQIQIKSQADDGPLIENGLSVERWLSSGWKVMNNRGLIIKQYEPFFDSTYHFRDDAKHGISKATSFYDHLGRPVCSFSPDRTWTKVVYDSWQTANYDASDVLLFDPQTDPHVGHFFCGLKGEDAFSYTWYSARKNSHEPLEKTAAVNTEGHHNTPTVTHMDSLGRKFLKVLDNGAFGSYSTRTDFDISGNVRKIIDARGRVIVCADFDMYGNMLYHSTMDFGQEWFVNDISGKTVLRWEDHDIPIRTEYDALRRPVGRYRGYSSSSGPEIQFQKYVYGEPGPGVLGTDAARYNLQGRLYKLFDRSGVVTSKYDFKGNIVSTARMLLRDYKSDINWNGKVAVELESEIFTKSISFDGLNRITELTNPDGTKKRYVYNSMSLPFSVKILQPTVAGGPEIGWVPIIASTDYDANCRKTILTYGNLTITKYTYDPLNFHIKRVLTLCNNIPLQDLNYTYDPRGNITHIGDKVQSDIFFQNTCVTPSKEYTYDPVNRLIEASGRGQRGLSVGSGDFVGNYTESYSYDPTGNILAIQHESTDAQSPGWTKRYIYNEDSPLEKGKCTNRLSRTEVGRLAEKYSYDAHGNVVSMVGFSVMEWDFQNQLCKTSRQSVNPSNDTIPETTYYVYDSDGNRVRKVTERQRTSAGAPTRLYDTIYIGGYEIFRKYDGDEINPSVERNTISIGSETPICRIETETKGTSGKVPIFRYQLSDHLGSVTLELSDTGEILSYEEYSPFGQTTYRVPVKRLGTPKLYRFSGKENDAETGLYYFGARYYAPGLGRWISPDPIGIGDGPNVYCYVDCNPVSFVDPDGKGKKSGSSGGSARGSAMVTTKQRKANEKEAERAAAAATPAKKNLANPAYIGHHVATSELANERAIIQVRANIETLRSNKAITTEYADHILAYVVEPRDMEGGNMYDPAKLHSLNLSDKVVDFKAKFTSPDEPEISVSINIDTPLDSSDQTQHVGSALKVSKLKLEYAEHGFFDSPEAAQVAGRPQMSVVDCYMTDTWEITTGEGRTVQLTRYENHEPPRYVYTPGS